MSFQPHLQIFTSPSTVQEGESTFHPFPLPPKEIRLEIWRQSLQRQRIIKVHLEPLAEERSTETTKSTRTPTESERYRAVVDGYQVLSKLLRVNSESSQEALGFYRVHLPCTLTVGIATLRKRQRCLLTGPYDS